MNPPTDHPRHLGAGWTVAIVASVVAIEVGLEVLPDQESLLTSWWSGVGLGVALLALSPLRRWPVLVAVLLTVGAVIDLAAGREAGVAVLHAVSHGAQYVVGGAVLSGLGRRRARVRSLPDLAVLLLASVLGGLIALAVEANLPVEELGSSTETTLQIGSQHALSILILGALLLSPRPSFLRSNAEGGRAGRVPATLWLQSATAGAAAMVVFVPETTAPITFAVIPVLAWGAIAFEVRVAAAQLLVLTGVVTLATANGRGPFANGLVGPEAIGPITLGYLACAALISLPVAVIVTQRRVLMRRVVADEQLFRRTFTASPLGMVLMRDAGGVLEVEEVNDAAVRLFGAPAGELEGRRFADLVGTLDQRAHVFDDLLNREVDSWHGQAAVLGRPGSRIDLAIAAVARGDTDQVFAAQLLDQTQEHESRRRLEVAHQLTDATLDTAGCLILVIDDQGTIIRTNAATKELAGYDDAALVGTRVWESPVPALTRAETEALFVWPNRSGLPMVRERLSHTAAGNPIRLVWNNNVVRNDAGAPTYAVLTGVDVTAERSSAGLMAHLLQASIGTAIIGIDVAGRITVLNAGAAHMLATSPEEMIGEPFVSILDPLQVMARTGAVGEQESFLCLVGMIGDEDESPTRDWTWRTRGGHELTVSMALSVTDDQVRDRVGFLCVARDVTEQREGQDTLVAALERERTAVERLRALDRAKDEFVSTVSHELRTPVTSILGFTELLLDDADETAPRQREMLETIARNSHRLIAICNDLLLLSGFESPDAVMHRESYDLREAVGVAEDFARAMAALRPVSVTFSSPDEPVLVSGDRNQLDRVVVNLVSNAVKFTEDGGRVDVRLSHDAGRGAVVSVGDTGIGIPPGDHELVFQRFYRTDDAQIRAIPGTGLGLSIVAGIVDAHGGSIDLESTPGAGTTVTVELPTVGSTGRSGSGQPA